MKLKTYEIQKKPGYRAVGLMWEGPWSEIGKLKSTIQTMNERVVELEQAVDSAMQLGLSYHTRQDGFTHYSVYEVTEEQAIPDGMVELRVPEMTYLVVSHLKGENIGNTYQSISQWLAESEYKPFVESGRTYHDPLPIKHERYPHNRDLEDPHFEIWIPVEKK
ncbi:Bacterial transcription activator, effector binding domain [Bacillus sp. THAF10]|uniref:GyrI-like domain-containing protein n=1 Tax=Bacillus sp. THAF10 TaxID=2587848 RepID=UPI001267FA85|nr:GyrI-like domain-containing protein [Bacillus sp. THAF10]QFT87923.1 Bacterial transcription activator, effector binding domain [Bacillus sp. THAF10]